MVDIHCGCHTIVELEPSFKQLRILQSEGEVLSSRQNFFLFLRLFNLFRISFLFLSLLFCLLFLLLFLLPLLLLGLRARPIALPHQIPRKAVVVSSMGASPMNDHTVQLISEIDSGLVGKMRGKIEFQLELEERVKFDSVHLFEVEIEPVES